MRAPSKVVFSSVLTISNPPRLELPVVPFRLFCTPDQKLYWLTIFCRGETGGERSHKRGSKSTPSGPPDLRAPARSTSLHGSRIFSEYRRLG